MNAAQAAWAGLTALLLIIGAVLIALEIEVAGWTALSVGILGWVLLLGMIFADRNGSGPAA